MKIEMVSREYAATFSQSNKFGVISEGCIGIWGEGETIENAIYDAEKNQKEYAGKSDLNGCYLMQII
jgi:predicted methyltransferase MtxX (methanogen marker protein 4)